MTVKIWLSPNVLYFNYLRNPVYMVPGGISTFATRTRGLDGTKLSTLSLNLPSSTCQGTSSDRLSRHSAQLEYPPILLILGLLRCDKISTHASLLRE